MSAQATRSAEKGKVITLKPFNPERYRFWVVSAIATLTVYNCHNIVLNQEPRPADPVGNNAPAIAARKAIIDWEHRHAQAREAILSSVPDKVMVSIYRFQHPHEMWDWLNQRFGTIADIKYNQAENKLRALVKSSSTSMKDHIDHFSALQETRDFVAPPHVGPLTNQQINIAFLASLGKDYSIWRQALGVTVNTMTPGQLFAEAQALDEENDSRTDSTSANNLPRDPNALNSNYSYGHSKGNGKTKFNGKGNGRFKPYDKSRSEQRTSDEKCAYCKEPQHKREECFKKMWADHQWINGKPKKHYSRKSAKNNGDKPKEKNGNDTSLKWNANHTSYSSSSNHSLVATDPFEWIVDSASNADIMPFKDRIRNYRSFEHVGTVKGLGGKRVTALGSGSVTLTGENGAIYTLEDVLYVPEHTQPILSLMKIRKHGFDFHFLSDYDEGDFLLSHPSSGIEFVGHAVDNILYIKERSPMLQALAVTTRSKKRPLSDLQSSNDSETNQSENSDRSRQPITNDRVTKDLSATPSAKSSPTISSCDPPNLWHLRLGHASATSLSKLTNIKSTFDTKDCLACIRAKAKRKPFLPSTMKSTRKGQLIHSDLSGPHKASKGRSKYFITFLDDFTHFCWVITIPDKNSITVRNAFEKWIRAFENKGIKIEYFRTDNGKEYEGYVTPVLNALGIEHQTTAPDSPQSNGKAERLNRTLDEMVRAMLYQGNLPESFWAEAMSSAAFILNYLPSSAIDDRTPFEAWYGNPPTSDCLRKIHPFGSIVHVYKERRQRWTKGKFAVRESSGCLVGYKATLNGELTDNYKYWDFERKQFLWSHNLDFTTKFPAHNSFDEPSLAPPVPKALLPAYQTQTESPTPIPKPPLPIEEPRPIYDEIVVEPPPALQVFSSYSTLPDGDPPTYADALRRPDAQKWINAMIEEIDALQAMDTWELCCLPRGRKCIGVKWVYKQKRDGNNFLLRYKARLVAKGYSQIAGIDYDKTFAPVVRIESVRCLLAFAAFYNLKIKHVDCKNAFVHGNSDVELYIHQPEGFVSKEHPHKILRLNRALYGLKQSPRIWYLCLCHVITGLGFEIMETDNSIYISTALGIILAVYVDDILIFSKTDEEGDKVFLQLQQYFEIKNLGFPETFLGLNISRDSEGSISINQSGYIDRMLTRFQMTDAISTKTPLDHSLPLRKTTKDEQRAPLTLYQEIIGSLNHLAVYSRPDISNSVSQLSQFLQDPSATHLKAARHVLRYLKRTRFFCITYGRSPRLIILGFADANWGGDINDRISTTGYVFMINNGAIAWTSHKQASVAISTMDSEYMAVSDASREAIARSQLFNELKVKLPPPLILCDNQGALDISENATNYQRAKHIDIRYHFIRHALQNDKITLDYIPSQENPADVLTKALTPQKHELCVQRLRLC